MVTYVIKNWHGAADATAIVRAYNQDQAFRYLKAWAAEDCCPLKPESEWSISLVPQNKTVHVVME